MSTALVPIVCALVVAGLCALGPGLIARLPEPEPEPEPLSGVEPAESGSGVAEVAVEHAPMTPMDGADAPAKTLYVDLAARPHLAVKLAIVGGLSGLLVGVELRDEPIVGGWVFLAVIGTLLGYIDAQTRLIPYRIIAPSYVVVTALVAVAALIDGASDDLVRAGLGWLAYGGFFFLMWLVYPRGLGYGDVRLAGVLGMALGYLGWGQVVVGVYAGLLLGGVIGGVLALVKIVDRKRYPFGPFMIAGAYVGLVWGGPFAHWYLGT